MNKIKIENKDCNTVLRENPEAKVVITSKPILVILEEAEGIPAPQWEAMEQVIRDRINENAEV
jgi:hypothetical protein